MSPFVLQLIEVKSDAEFARWVAETTNTRGLRCAYTACRYRGLALRSYAIERRLKQLQTQK